MYNYSTPCVFCSMFHLNTNIDTLSADQGFVRSPYSKAHQIRYVAQVTSFWYYIYVHGHVNWIIWAKGNICLIKRQITLSLLGWKSGKRKRYRYIHSTLQYKQCSTSYLIWFYFRKATSTYKQTDKHSITQINKWINKTKCPLVNCQACILNVIC